MRSDTTPEGFTKEIQFTPAYDKRDPDPSKNYGIRGVTIRFLLIGPLGATQFVLYSGMQLQHIYKERKGNPEPGYCPWMGADVGYHSLKPIYESQTSMECDIIAGGTCYYDGSSLAAVDVANRFVAEGEDVVWEELQKWYQETFDPEEEERDG